MSQSFEDKLRKKLADYKKSPSADQKAMLFGKSTGLTKSRFPFLALTRFLCLWSIVMITPVYISQEPLNNSSTFSSQLTSPYSDNNAITYSTNAQIEEIQTEIIAKSEQVEVPLTESFNTPSNNSSESKQIAVEDRARGEYKVPSKMLSKKVGLAFAETNEFDFIEFEGLQDSVSTLPAQKRNPIEFDFYADAGLFFLYQQVEPDLSDEVIIDDFKGADRFSLNRVGALIEIGIKKELSEKTSLNLGVNLNVYQQNFTFNVREIAPTDAVQASEPTTFSSVFTNSTIEMRNVIVSTGIKAGWDFHVLPNKYDAFYLAAEYNQVLNPTHEFIFEEKSYDTFYPNQWMISAGIRKKMFESRIANATIIPNIRYSFLRSSSDKAPTLSVKPFSAGLTLSFVFK